MEEIMQSRLDKIESIQEIHLNNCNLRYESCEYIANMIEKKGSFEIKEANFSGIFNDDIDTDEINSALKILDILTPLTHRKFFHYNPPLTTPTFRRVPGNLLQNHCCTRVREGT